MLWIGLHLPDLSLESFVATLLDVPAAPGATPSEVGADTDAAPRRPVALVEHHRLVAVDVAARGLGLAPGQKRATALAIAPHVRLGEADATRDAAALLAIVHAVMAFTPAVSVAPNHVVLAEVAASLRYFGGLPRLLDLLRERLAPLGHAFRIACAPTAQAAQWLSAWRDDAAVDGPPPRSAADWRARIGALPLSAMAAARPHLAALETLGLATAADLWRQPRAGVTRRFGGELLADIDRALGDLADPRVSLEPAPEFDSRLELFMRADDSAALLVGAAVLLNRLTAWAMARHGLVCGFALRLHHETRRRMRDDPSTATTTLDIALGEPVADTAHLQALLRERLQRLPLAASVIEMSLHCDAIAPGAPPNAELFPSAASAGEGWHRLLERIEARLGAHNLQRLHPVADHRPGLSTRVIRGAPAGAARPGMAAAASGARRGAAKDEPLGLAFASAQVGAPSGDPADWPRLRRPVWLLASPRPLRERDGSPLWAGRPLWLVAGPERIEAGWWDDQYAARDYFIAQADDGALLWVYRLRQAPRDGESGWSLQGRFG